MVKRPVPFLHAGARGDRLARGKVAMRHEIWAAVRGGSLGREVSKQVVMPVLQELKLNQSCKWGHRGRLGQGQKVKRMG